MQKITPFLWFDQQAEDAARFYTSVFKNFKIGAITRYDEEGAKASGRSPGSAMVVSFQIEGQGFSALNGGPHFKFNEAISFVVNCHSQEEIDYYWEKLSEGGDERAQQCGWLKDKFGVSWQIVPVVLQEMLSDPAKSRTIMHSLLQMKKIDIKALVGVEDEEEK